MGEKTEMHMAIERHLPDFDQAFVSLGIDPNMISAFLLSEQLRNAATEFRAKYKLVIEAQKNTPTREETQEMRDVFITISTDVFDNQPVINAQHLTEESIFKFNEQRTVRRRHYAYRYGEKPPIKLGKYHVGTVNLKGGGTVMVEIDNKNILIIIK